jgi:hypothetical protein
MRELQRLRLFSIQRVQTFLDILRKHAEDVVFCEETGAKKKNADAELDSTSAFCCICWVQLSQQSVTITQQKVSTILLRPRGGPGVQRRGAKVGRAFVEGLKSKPPEARNPRRFKLALFLDSALAGQEATLMFTLCYETRVLRDLQSHRPPFSRNVHKFMRFFQLPDDLDLLIS